MKHVIIFRAKIGFGSAECVRRGRDDSNQRCWLSNQVRDTISPIFCRVWRGFCGNLSGYFRTDFKLILAISRECVRTKSPLISLREPSREVWRSHRLFSHWREFQNWSQIAAKIESVQTEHYIGLNGPVVLWSRHFTVAPTVSTLGCPIMNFSNDTASLWNTSTQWRVVTCLHLKPALRRKPMLLLGVRQWNDWNVVLADDTEVAITTRGTFVDQYWKLFSYTVKKARKIARRTNLREWKLEGPRFFYKKKRYVKQEFIKTNSLFPSSYIMIPITCFVHSSKSCLHSRKGPGWPGPWKINWK